MDFARESWRMPEIREEGSDAVGLKVWLVDALEGLRG